MLNKNELNLVLSKILPFYSQTNTTSKCVSNKAYLSVYKIDIPSMRFSDKLYVDLNNDVAWFLEYGDNLELASVLTNRYL